MDLSAALQTYLTESNELLEQMESLLLQLDQQSDPQESLHAIFRAAHTIKGSAGLFDLDNIVVFSHDVENLLDHMRAGDIAVSHKRIVLLLDCCDHISALIEAHGANQPESAELLACGSKLTAELQQAMTPAPAQAHSQQYITGHTALASATADSRVERLSSHQVDNDNWHLSLRFGKDALRDGMDPLAFIRYLATLGSIVSIVTLDDALPEPAQMDAESCYMGFEINFSSSADKQQIESVFEFVRHDSLIRILPPHSQLLDYIEHIQQLPEQDLKLGEILLRCGSLTQAELTQALQQQAAVPAIPLGNIMVQQGMTTQEVLDAAVQKQSKVRDAQKREAQSIRVEADKLDQLINLIGELVIASAGSVLDAQTVGDSKLIESMSALAALVEQIRDVTLRLRMVQIGGTFNRFKRVVHDVANTLQKQIELQVSGADTELDKTLVEKIADPLLHLVRNAIDHGIEMPAQRLAAGKNACGVVQLNACHDAGNILIEVRDDGAGLNAERIWQKALAKGLVTADAKLDTPDIYQLIFEPGFSTADKVTDLSGRGVGMDVVRRNIEALRGSVELHSAPGQGTIFRIRMPLTLAIIDGFLVRVNNASFIIPLEMVQECIELDSAALVTGPQHNYVNLRDKILPFIRLRDHFATGGTVPRRENVVVVKTGGQQAGLVVDQLVGEYHTVIKPLSKVFGHADGLSGFTILGSGEVALILDIPRLVAQAEMPEHAQKNMP
ncbi:chemotaxis protein CheA [Shewanella sp. CG12_big_fil_rev_8_21_14_0_65_47_15]|uniref:chemotaxis protein CheA n=1 Tax=Shewanella sp. CG12_big_fil_rev_8_21_14_0_65_47_15 TaxID=1975537 RepID=UPI000CAD2D0B|nr:chemotaxis protein CheA [Shewanella sp. CG12_big_fil_rev_8_21_14_0_65_47_15]PIW59258.1 MAG: chemotaxis protein CheA [Shewanella sp. CG12_big_fil_rev_8_21_14_0_65_47_15]